MKKSVAIIGGGPASMMLAATLDEKKFEVTIYEKNFALGRKFLVAGGGGFNLTHSENIEDFISRYTPVGFLEPALRNFTNEDLRGWLKEIGIETYVGTSKRVFPVKGIKPIDVLNAILIKLKQKGVQIKTRHEWCGWDEGGNLLFNYNSVPVSARADLTVFSLGGASWKKTGSDGSWRKLFADQDITIEDFYPPIALIKLIGRRVFLKTQGENLLKIFLFPAEVKQKKASWLLQNLASRAGPFMR